MTAPRPTVLMVAPTGLMSGAESVLVRLANAAASEGWHVEAACPSGPLPGALAAAGSRVHRLPELKLPAGPLPLALGRLAARTALAARKLHGLCGRADVVLVNSMFALPALRLARPVRPVAWHAHDVLTRRKWKAVVRAGGNVVTSALAVSESAAAPLRACGMAVEVIRNGTPWPVAPVGDSPPSPPLVGCVAQLTQWKGLDVLLEAAAHLSGEVKVELVGGSFPKDAPFVEELHRRAETPDLKGRVSFVGRVQDTLPRMRTWNVAINASVAAEAGPLVPLEAMSIGVPIVATDLGGTSEVLGEAGLLVPPGDPGALARAVSRLLSDRALWRRCHEAGPLQIVKEGLTLDRQLEHLLGTLGRLADERRRR